MLLIEIILLFLSLIWVSWGGAVQILQRSGSVTLDRSHDFELLDLVLMLAMQPLLVHTLITHASNCTDLKEAFCSTGAGLQLSALCYRHHHRVSLVLK